MNLDRDFVQVSKLSEDKKKVFTKNGALFFPKFKWRPKKKGLHQKWNTFFPKFKWTPTLRWTSESNCWGDADVDHTQTTGEDTVKLLGWIYPLHPPPPRVSAPLHTSVYLSFSKFYGAGKATRRAIEFLFKIKKTISLLFFFYGCSTSEVCNDTKDRIRYF